METDEILPLSRVTAADVESKVQLAVSRVTGAVESIALVQYSIPFPPAALDNNRRLVFLHILFLSRPRRLRPGKLPTSCDVGHIPATDYHLRYH